MYRVSLIKIFQLVLLCRRGGISHYFPSGEHQAYKLKQNGTEKETK